MLPGTSMTERDDRPVPPIEPGAPTADSGGAQRITGPMTMESAGTVDDGPPIQPEPPPALAPLQLDPTIDEAPAPPPGPAPGVAPPRSRRLLALGLAVGVPAFLIGVAFAARGPIVRHVVTSRAADLGVDLTFDDLDLSLDAARLTGVRISLAGVHGLSVRIDTLSLGLRRLSVESMDAAGVSFALEGPATDRLLELAKWSSDHVAALRIPGAAKGVRLDWRAKAGSAAWLTMTGGSASGDGANAQLVASAVAFGVPAGTVVASVAVDAAGVTLEAGRKQGGLAGPAPLTAALHTKTQPPTLDVTLRPIDPTALGEALGVTLPAHAAMVSGHVELTLGKTGSTGTASLDIDGWVPPHPRNLDSIVYGKKTTLTSRLTLAEDRASVTFDGLELRAGKLLLKGSGSMAEEEKRTMLHLDLAGTLPCNELARNAASKELPGILGDLFGEVAGRAVGGSARLNVTVEADAKNLASAKITPKVSVGCALKMPRL